MIDFETTLIEYEQLLTKFGFDWFGRDPGEWRIVYKNKSRW